MEELLKLTGAQLKAMADEKGIDYPSRITNPKLAELIHAHNEKTQQDAGAETANDAADVAQAAQETGGKNQLFLEIGEFTVVEGQMVKVLTKNDDGEMIEGEISLDDLLEKDEIATIEMIEAHAKKVSSLKESVAVLEAKITELELRDVATGLDMSSDSDVQVETVTASQKPTWKEGAETVRIRARVVPNKNVAGRIRAGVQLGVQYSEHEVDEATFNALVADSYLQVEILEAKYDG